MIIEDDQFIQDLISRKFLTEGFQTMPAPSSVQAFDYLINKGILPDIIILDIMLPGMDGFEILKEIKANATFARIPVIIFSNLGEQKYIDRAQELGVQEYVIKANFTLDELVEKVRGYLNITK